MSLSRPQLVLFDLDGTLVDTAPDLALSVNAALTELGIDTCNENQVRLWIGSGIESLLHRALTGDVNGRADDELYQHALQEFRRYYFDNIAVKSTIYPGVQEALLELQQADIHLACMTNKATRYTEKLLHVTGLFDSFGLIVCGDTLPVLKPDPAPLFHATNYFNVTVENSLMVGDSATDVKAARNAGMAVACVPYGYNQGRDIQEEKPDLVIKDLPELVDHFRNTS